MFNKLLNRLKNTKTGNDGIFNSGRYNFGDYNTGDFNTGNYNTGDYNRGSGNTGIQNSGNNNTGNHNIGYANSGIKNVGDFNTGNYNSGNNNCGNRNHGNNNCGDWNDGSYYNGCFNTESQKIFLFNKPSDWTYQDWLQSEGCKILSECPANDVLFIPEDEMTSKEKVTHPEYRQLHGYIKINVVSSEEMQLWWDALSTNKQNTIMNLPNFDIKVFEKITKIHIENN